MGFGIKIDQAKCDGCGTCFEVCPSECFGEPKGGKTNVVTDKRDDCVGCRACETQCPQEAIVITED